jgi:hypothetical protein
MVRSKRKLVETTLEREGIISYTMERGSLRLQMAGASELAYL